MPLFRVGFIVTCEVEADNEDEAFDNCPDDMNEYNWEPQYAERIDD